ncbi:uncharacterized protein LOC135350023 isoform X2 [Halichondria panicea]|uniref:uncharacterized protein LOC135350023 isoform X2 n=1 Tax=Halichondria panicea TaxID=6063 RepID=UPI00312B9627
MSSWHTNIYIGEGAQRTSAERRKLKKQQEEIQEDHRAYLSKREAERREKVEKQRKDLEQLQQYNPWGRPAVGVSTKSGCGYDPYGKPGAGALLRTSSGKLTTHIKGARDIKFQDHLKREVDSMRCLPGGPEKSGRQKNYKLERSDSEKLLMIEERNRKLIYGKKLEEQRLEDIDRREREKRELKDAPSDYIWGRNEVSRRDARKRVMDWDTYSSDSGFTSIAAQMRKRGYEAPIPIINQGVEEFDPWGRPGAGAPMRNRQGQVMQLGRGCGVDMATLMKAKDVERKVDHRQKYGENHNPNSRGSKSYYTDLQDQAELRHKQLQQRRHDDKKLDVLHTETMAQMWEKEGRRRQPDEQNHVLSFNEPWRRAGAGAPRLKRHSQLDAIPGAQEVHSHWMV